MDSRVRME
ncbi:unnamed protein product, partial [Didymodactylos carnosus]